MANLPVLGPLFTPEWRDRYAPIIERSMIAEGQVTYQTGEEIYDPVTDTWTTPHVVVYSGKMRVQPLRTAQHREPPGNATEQQTYLFSVPYSATDIDFRSGMTVKVTNGGLNRSLEGYEFVIVEMTDSSNPIEKTFYAVQNLETRSADAPPLPGFVTYRWTGAPYQSVSEEVNPDGTVRRRNVAYNPNPVAAGANTLWQVLGATAGSFTAPGEVTIGTMPGTRNIQGWVNNGAPPVGDLYTTITFTVETEVAGLFARAGFFGVYEPVTPGVEQVLTEFNTANNPGYLTGLSIQGPPAPGSRVLIRNVLAQISPTAPTDLTYFDGNTPPRRIP